MNSTDLPDGQWATGFYRQTVTENPYLSDSVPMRWDGANPKQFVFLSLPVKEILYGGACGGGKSIALLVASLQFVTVPGYSALLLRRTFADLAKPGALMDLSMQLLGKSNAVWNEQKHKWNFPNGATLSFGYLETERDKYTYQSSEFHFIGFDELSQFTKTQYTYLFSRLRKPAGMSVPLRMRAASNPGGPGANWVYDRFVNPKTKSPGREFIPARLEDNPKLDAASYEESLMELDHITRRQLRHGDWDIKAEGNCFKREWFHSFSRSGSDYILRRGPSQWAVPVSACRRFITADTAATEKTTADYTVIQVWDITPAYDMLLVHQYRGQIEVPAVCDKAESIYQENGPEWIGIEKAHAGIAVLQTLKGRGLSIRAMHPKGDKLQRAGFLMIRAEAGQIFLPEGAAWVDAYIDEHVAFPPSGGGHDDQVDAGAYMAKAVHKMGGSPTTGRAARVDDDGEHGDDDAIAGFASTSPPAIPDGAVATATAVDDPEVAAWLAGED
jgi:predicted phage terminase large subunit-like protein